MRLTIGKRLAFSFLFIILIATTIGIISIFYFTKLNAITAEITTQNHPRIYAVNEIKNSIQDLERAAETHLSLLEKAPVDSVIQPSLVVVQDELDEVEQSLEVLKSIRVSPQDTSFQKWIFGFGENFASLKLATAEITGPSPKTITSEIKAKAESEFFEITNNLKKECNRLRRAETEKVDYLSSQARAKSLAGFKYVIILLFLGLIVGIILAYRTTYTLARPIGQLSEATELVSKGNLEVKLQVNNPPELKQLAESFSRMTAKLKDAFEKQKLLVAQVSHQLRTPLTVVRGHAEVALRGPEKESAEYKQALSQVIESTKQISKFVANLLTLSQAEFGQLPLNRSIVDLNEILRDAQQQAQALYGSRNFQLKLEDERQDLPVNADPERVKELLLILVENAVKYTKPNGLIEIGSRVDSNQIQAFVKDDGIGISEKHLPHIFDRFYRVKNENAQSGFGLGLTIAKWIIEAHQADMTVESQIGKGSCFTVTFPRSK